LKQASCSDDHAKTEDEVGSKKLCGTAAHSGLKNTRVGLERATSCHDHNGFQANPHQVFKRSIHVDEPDAKSEFLDSNSKEKKLNGRRTR
jgi:hypothetical protein